MPSIGNGTRKKLFKEVMGRCGYCGIYLGEKFEIDHVIPKSISGTGQKTNLIACCRDCNKLKLDRGIGDFKTRLGIYQFWFEQIGIKKGSCFIRREENSRIPILSAINICPYEFERVKDTPPFNSYRRETRSVRQAFSWS